jgi:hypothetical protein
MSLGIHSGNKKNARKGHGNIIENCNILKLNFSNKSSM